MLRKLLATLFQSEAETKVHPNIKFGRYNDAYKSKEKYDAWDKALKLFDEGSYKASYLSFLDYLTDEEEGNIKFWEADDKLYFDLYHGSKKTHGYIDDKEMYAEAVIASAESLNVGFLRKLVEQNYLLKYGKYALDDDDNLCILFYSSKVDGSPYKLYYGLKELALNADKQDDLLVDEFEMLKHINNGHIERLGELELETKYNYLIEEIGKVFHEIDNGTLRRDKYPGGIAYMLLDLCYRLDYLIKPEGFVMEQFEKVHRLFFANDGKNAGQKNMAMRKEFQIILDRSKADIIKELYNVSSTFGITAPVDHARLAGLIEGEIGNMDWYVENKHDTIARAIPGYIVSYSLFNYAVPIPDRQLLHLYMMVTQHDFFKDLGFNINFMKNGVPNKKEIELNISRLISRNKDVFPKLKPNYKILKYDSMAAFSKSYLLMMKSLDLSKAEK